MFYPKFKPKVTPKPEQGFTLLDVLVAILVSTTFFLVGMQAIVIGAMLRVKANRANQASAWIQESIEEIRFKALNQTGSLPYTGNESACSATSTTTGFAEKLKVLLPSVDSAKYVTKNSKTYSAVTSTTYRPNPNNFNGTTGQKVWLLRTDTPKPTAPYNVLEVGYLAVLDNNNSPSSNDQDIVGQLYTEVIPDAAFKCQ